jgi:phage-related tail fiber protein
MAEAVTTDQFRRFLAKHFCDNGALPRLGFMAFGDGGHNADGSAKTPDPARTALAHELVRKPLLELYQEDDMSVTASGRLEDADLPGYWISEAGVFDESGRLVGYRFFAPKVKEADETYLVRIKLRF